MRVINQIVSAIVIVLVFRTMLGDLYKWLESLDLNKPDSIIRGVILLLLFLLVTWVVASINSKFARISSRRDKLEECKTALKSQGNLIYTMAEELLPINNLRLLSQCEVRVGILAESNMPLDSETIRLQDILKSNGWSLEQWQAFITKANEVFCDYIDIIDNTTVYLGRLNRIKININMFLLTLGWPPNNKSRIRVIVLNWLSPKRELIDYGDGRMMSFHYFNKYHTYAVSIINKEISRLSR